MLGVQATFQLPIFLYTDSRIAIVSSCALSTGKMPSEGLPMNSVAWITHLAPNVFEGVKENARKSFTFNR